MVLAERCRNKLRTFPVAQLTNSAPEQWGDVVVVSVGVPQVTIDGAEQQLQGGRAAGGMVSGPEQKGEGGAAAPQKQGSRAGDAVQRRRGGRGRCSPAARRHMTHDT